MHTRFSQGYGDNVFEIRMNFDADTKKTLKQR